MKIIAKSIHSGVEIEIYLKVTPKADESKAVNVIFDMLREQQFDAEKITIEREP